MKQHYIGPETQYIFSGWPHAEPSTAYQVSLFTDKYYGMDK